MSRHIDADALMQAMYHRAFETDGDTMWQSGCWVRYRAIEQVVKEQPTVEERKTGAWIFYDSDAERYDDIRCSVCGKHFTVDAERWCDIGFIASDLKYCPNCGAKMEGGKDE